MIWAVSLSMTHCLEIYKRNVAREGKAAVVWDSGDELC